MSNKTGFQDFYDYEGSKKLIELVTKDVDRLNTAFGSLVNNMLKMQGQLKTSVNETKASITANNQAIAAMDKTQMSTVDSTIKLTKENEKLAKSGRETQASVRAVDQIIKQFSYSVEGQRALISTLTAEFNKLDPTVAKNASRINEIGRAIQSAQGNIKVMQSAIRTANADINRATASYDQLTAAIAKDVAALKQIPGVLDRSSAAYRQNATEIQTLQDRIRQNTDALKQFDAQIGRNFRNVGNYTSALGRLGGIAGSFGAAFGLTSGVFLVAQGTRAAIQNNIAYSDSLVNVQRTTDLTSEQVRVLADELKTLNTRTSTAGLLEIATAAGRLQVAEKDLVSFTKAVDVVTQALGDELNGTTAEIATTLGRIVSLFGDDEELGLETSIIRLGSVINELGKNSKSNAGFITDFTLRLAGVAPQANITSGEIVALGAALGEIAPQRVEAVGTAMTRFFTQMGSDAKRYARLANMDIQEFTDLLNNDAVEAMLRVFEASGKSVTGLEAISQALGDLGIEQERAKQILGAFANQTERTRELLAIYREEAKESTSVYEEFDQRVDSLAGSFDRMANSFVNLTTNGGAAESVLAGLFNQINGMLIALNNFGLLIKKDPIFGGIENLTVPERLKFIEIGVTRTGKAIRTFFNDLRGLNAEEIIGIREQESQKIVDAFVAEGESAKEARLLVDAYFSQYEKDALNASEATRLFQLANENNIKTFEEFTEKSGILDIVPKNPFDENGVAQFLVQLDKAADKTKVLEIIQGKFNRKVDVASKGAQTFAEWLDSIGIKIDELSKKSILDIFDISVSDSEIGGFNAEAAAEKLRKETMDALKSLGNLDFESEIENFILSSDWIDDEFQDALDQAADSADQWRDEQEQKDRESIDRRKQIIRELATAGFDVLNSFADTYFQNQQIRLRNEEQALNDYYDRQTKLAGDNTAAKEQLEVRFQEESRKLRQKQAEAERRATLFNLALKIPEAFVVGLIQGGPVIGAIYAGVASAQLAAASAVEVPAFAEGTDNAPGGAVIVNDKPRPGGVNRELITTPSGKQFYFDTDRPVLTDMIPKGSKIDSRDISQIPLGMDYSPIHENFKQMHQGFQQAMSSQAPKQERFDYDKLAKAVVSQLPDIQQIIFEQDGSIKKARIKGNTTRITGRIDPLRQLKAEIKNLKRK